MPVKFVEAACFCGIAFCRRSPFANLDNLRSQLVIFWSVAILLRLVALPARAGRRFWRYQWEGKVQNAGFNPYVIAPDDPKLERSGQNFPIGADQSSRLSARSIRRERS